MRERAGLFDMTSLTRIEVAGPGAESFLLWMLAGRVDRPVGSVTYTVMLDVRGGIRSDVTVARLAEERFLIGGNGPRDLAWLRRHLPPDGSVAVSDLTETTCCAALWGPAARAIVEPIAEGDLAFGYLQARELRVGAVPVTATRISYAGESGWELVAATRARPGVVGRDLGRGQEPRDDRGGARRARLPQAGEGIPGVGCGHDARARSGGDGSGLHRAARRHRLPRARRPHGAPTRPASPRVPDPGGRPGRDGGRTRPRERRAGRLRHLRGLRVQRRMQHRVRMGAPASSARAIGWRSPTSIGCWAPRSPRSPSSTRGASACGPEPCSAGLLERLRL